MTDRLGRLLLVTLEAACVNAERPVLGALHLPLDSGRGNTTQSAFTSDGRSLVVLSREHDWSGGR